MQLPAVLRQLYLHYFYNTIFKIKHKLHTALGSAPSAPPTQYKFWVLTWLSVYVSDDGVRKHKEQRATEVRRAHWLAKWKP